MRLDIMTDIETLGKGEDATIIQLSAGIFDIDTGVIYDTFNGIVDITLEDSIKVDPDTLLWWLDTDKELFTKLLNSGESTEKKLLSDFYFWILDNVRYCKDKDTTLRDVYLWGNGILFDNKIIQAKMKHYDISYPIFYRNDRDMRTIVELASVLLNIENEKDFREKYRDKSLVAHDALDDVKSQIGVLCKAWDIVIRG